MDKDYSTIASYKLVRHVANEYGGGIKKGFGQNFLVNEKILRRLIARLNIKDNDIVVEIGPGIGVLTYSLCQLAKKVIMIELDKAKEKAIHKVLENFNNYEIIFADASEFNFNDVPKSANLKIIGALPFNHAKRIIANLFESGIIWNEAVFVVQLEVGESYSSTPPDADFLSNYARIFAEASFEFKIKPVNFVPIPKVDSAVIKFTQKKDEISISEKLKIAGFIKSGFSQPRKKLRNNLKGFDLANEALNYLDKRPAQLSLNEWEFLFRTSTSRL